MRRAIYSGPNRSGMCICGHSWQDHHLGMVATEKATHTDGGIELYVPQECEAFGFNENGGRDANGHIHCFGYKDTLDERHTSKATSEDC